MTTTQNQYDQPKLLYYSVSDTSFVTGDSPVTLDVNATLLRNSIDGYIMNDGAGSFTVNLSQDGSTFGNDILINNGESFSLKTISIDKIKITWIADSSYRVFAV